MHIFRVISQEVRLRCLASGNLLGLEMTSTSEFELKSKPRWSSEEATWMSMMLVHEDACFPSRFSIASGGVLTLSIATGYLAI